MYFFKKIILNIFIIIIYLLKFLFSIYFPIKIVVFSIFFY